MSLVVELENLMDGQRKMESRSLATVINHLDGKILLRKGERDLMVNVKTLFEKEMGSSLTFSCLHRWLSGAKPPWPVL